jgi:hypothetical protein
MVKVGRRSLFSLSPYSYIVVREDSHRKMPVEVLLNYLKSKKTLQREPQVQTKVRV